MKILSESERKLLRVLQDEGRISNVALAERVGMSETPCLRRVKLLEESGVITGYRADLDPAKLGLTVSAFVYVTTDQRSETDRKLFMTAIDGEPQIVSCAATSGAYDFVLEVVAADVEALGELTMNRLLSLPTVRSISSSVVFRWLKRNRPLPV